MVIIPLVFDTLIDEEFIDEDYLKVNIVPSEQQHVAGEIEIQTCIISYCGYVIESKNQNHS